ncbi:hypothetical protein CASFOL_007616 [Castilleja foliolosa]|uniref:Uncharacterized protein n=1 Tax=Castilleja foliolosa TaxID=1961234 RepID=A0ABD3E1J8_9LAMI
MREMREIEERASRMSDDMISEIEELRKTVEHLQEKHLHLLLKKNIATSSYRTD